MAMRFSVWPEPGRSVSEILDLARLGDELGWFGFWFADHYMPNTGSADIKPGDVHEVWSILPAVAAVTSSIRVGPLVAPTSVHHPALLANRIATLDHVAAGRAVLGLGAGWQINEHAAYGIALEEPKTRVDRFDEAIQITRSLLDNDRTSFAGTHYTITDAPADPKPVQNRLPILVGTGGRRMCAITARHAQEWNTWGAPEMATSRRAVFDDACARVGVDPASKHTSVQAVVAITEDQERLARMTSGPMAERTIAGSSEQIVDAIGELKELGFAEFIVFDAGLGRSTEERLDGYRRFDAEVAVHFA